MLLSGNATQIAEQLASVLGVTPINLTAVMVGLGPPVSSVRYYKTASGSEIITTFVDGVFVRLDYRSPIQSARAGTFTPLNASAGALKILAGIGLQIVTDRLIVMDENFSPQRYAFSWNPAYAGIHINGTLVKNGDGSYLIEGYDLNFEFDPQSGIPTRIVLTRPNWYTVGDGFPLNVSALQAAQIATTYAQGLGMTTISQPLVNFVVIDGSLYYVVTVGNSSQAFNLVINPRTGEVGLPS